MAQQRLRRGAAHARCSPCALRSICGAQSTGRPRRTRPEETGVRQFKTRFRDCRNTPNARQGWTRLGDPHVLEFRERRQDGAAVPRQVLAIRQRQHLELGRRGRRHKALHLARQALRDAGKQGVAAREHDVRVRVLAHRWVDAHHRAVEQFLEGVWRAERCWKSGVVFEERLCAPEPRTAHRDHGSGIARGRQLVARRPSSKRNQGAHLGFAWQLTARHSTAGILATRLLHEM